MSQPSDSPKTDNLTHEAAIALFDSLQPATTDQMKGWWIGSEIATGHPMDGMLASSYWHGKRFEGEDAVHPLVHQFPVWGEISVNPALLPLHFITRLPMRDPFLSFILPVIAPLFRTRHPKARLRTLEFRGRMHAAMCYDAKPIHDVFAVLGPDCLMGWMDFKDMERPYFFKLTREN